MPPEEIVPTNAVERAIVDGRAGHADSRSVAEAVWVAPLIVPSGVPAQGLHELAPIIFDREGVPMIAVFSDPSRVQELAAEAPYFIVLSGRELMTRMTPGHGLVINPRTLPIGMEISPEGIAETVQTFA